MEFSVLVLLKMTWKSRMLRKSCFIRSVLEHIKVTIYRSPYYTMFYRIRLSHQIIIVTITKVNSNKFKNNFFKLSKKYSVPSMRSSGDPIPSLESWRRFLLEQLPLVNVFLSVNAIACTYLCLLKILPVATASPALRRVSDRAGLQFFDRACHRDCEEASLLRGLSLSCPRFKVNSLTVHRGTLNLQRILAYHISVPVVV